MAKPPAMPAKISPAGCAPLSPPVLLDDDCGAADDGGDSRGVGSAAATGGAVGLRAGGVVGGKGVVVAGCAVIRGATMAG